MDEFETDASSSRKPGTAVTMGASSAVSAGVAASRAVVGGVQVATESQDTAEADGKRTAAELAKRVKQIFADRGGSFTIDDPIGIPPPAPYVGGRDYCSNPEWAWTMFESEWQHACYNHDVCYGSQRGRLYCDVTFYKEIIAACKANHAWWLPMRYWCYSDAGDWYLAVRAFGGSHYTPRRTSYDPRGN